MKTFEDFMNEKTNYKIKPKTKVWVEDLDQQEKRDLQRVAFKSGFEWLTTTGNQFPRYLDESAYFFNEDMTISRSKKKADFEKSKFKEVQASEILYGQKNLL